MDPPQHGGRKTRPPSKEQSPSSRKHSKDKKQKFNATSSNGKNQSHFKTPNKPKKSSPKNHTHSGGTKNKTSKKERPSQMNQTISSGGSPQKKSRPFSKNHNQSRTRHKGCLEWFCDWLNRLQSDSRQKELKRIKNKPSKNLQKQKPNIDQKGTQFESSQDKRDWDNSTVKIDVSQSSEEPNFNLKQRQKYRDKQQNNQNLNNTEIQLIKKPSPEKRLQEQFKDYQLVSPSNQRSRPNSGLASQRHERIGLTQLQQINRLQPPYFSKRTGDRDRLSLQKKAKNQPQNKQKIISEQSNQRKNNFYRQKSQNSVIAQHQKSIEKNIKSPETKSLKKSKEQQEKSIDPKRDKIDDSEISFVILGSVLESKSPQKNARNNSKPSQKQISKSVSKLEKNLKNTLASSFNEQKDKNRTLQKKLTYRPTQSHFLPKEQQEQSVFNQQTAKKSQIFGISFIQPKKKNGQFTQAKKLDDDQLLLNLNGLALESRRFSEDDKIRRTITITPRANFAKKPYQDFNQAPLVGGIPKSSRKRQSQDLKKTKGISKNQNQKQQTNQDLKKGCLCHHKDCSTLKCGCRLNQRPCTQLCRCIAKDCTNNGHLHKNQDKKRSSTGLKSILSMGKEEDLQDENGLKFDGPKFQFEEKPSPKEEKQQESVENKQLSSDPNHKQRSSSDGSSQFISLLNYDYPFQPNNNNNPASSIQQSEKKQQQKKRMSSSDKK